MTTTAELGRIPVSLNQGKLKSPTVQVRWSSTLAPVKRREDGARGWPGYGGVGASWNPRSQNRDLGHPRGLKNQRLDRPVTYCRCGILILCSPRSQNRDLGHPRGLKNQRLDRPVAYCRCGIPILCSPRSQNRDLGHPFKYNDTLVHGQIEGCGCGGVGGIASRAGNGYRVCAGGGDGVADGNRAAATGGGVVVAVAGVAGAQGYGSC